MIWFGGDFSPKIMIWFDTSQKSAWFDLIWHEIIFASIWFDLNLPTPGFGLWGCLGNRSSSSPSGQGFYPTTSSRSLNRRSSYCLQNISLTNLILHILNTNKQVAQIRRHTWNNLLFSAFDDYHSWHFFCFFWRHRFLCFFRFFLQFPFFMVQNIPFWNLQIMFSIQKLNIQT